MSEAPRSDFAIYLRPRNLLPQLQPEYCIQRFPATIGRHPTNDIELPYDSISRFHARLDLKDGELSILDLRSSNGTSVNGRRVENSVLRDQDVLSLGGIDMTLAMAQDPSESDLRGSRIDSETSVHFVNEDKSVVQSVVEADLADETSDISTLHKKALEGVSLERARDRLSTFYQLQEILRSTTDEKNLFRRLLSLLFQVLPVDRGVILTRDTDDSGLFNPVAVQVKEGLETGRGIGISKTILMRCLRDRVAILTQDAAADERFGGAKSVVAQQMRSVMCVPLISHHHVFGFIQLDSSSASRTYDNEDLAFLANLAVEVGLQLHNLRMIRKQIMSERMAAIGQTITGLAHNIKNVLLLSKGGMDLMDQRLKDKSYDTLDETWGIVKRGVDRINVMVNEMLDYSRVREVRKNKVQVNDMLREIRETFAEEMTQRGVTCELELDRRCPPVMIDADGLDKALVNLLINAIEECIEGEGVIRLRSSYETEGCLAIEVADNAGGIPVEVLPRIFFPFFTTKGSKGSGLGLAMTKKFVEDMGGRIEVQTKDGVGTTFRITLFLDRNDIRLEDPSAPLIPA
jgi:two-component system, NtrC family, sensor kinase